MSHLRQSRHRLAGWIGKPTKAPKRKKEETNKESKEMILEERRVTYFAPPIQAASCLCLCHIHDGIFATVCLRYMES